MTSLAPVAPVMLGTALSQLALGLMSTLVPLLMLQDGASSGVIGLVASGY